MPTNLGNKVQAPFSLLLLKLQRNSSNRALLDSLHEVGDETSDLISHSLGRNDCHLAGDALVGVKIQRQTRIVLLDNDSRRLLDGFSSDTLIRRKHHKKIGWVNTNIYMVYTCV